MVPKILKHALLVTAISAFCAGATACYAEAVPAPAYGDGYAPQYYDGYVVYYDGVGRPFYYANGAVFWVPPGSPYYGGLVGHWRTYGPAYRRWYVNRGYQYRGYRRR